MLWQRLFWSFGHPDVYIQFIPATGFVSMIVQTFSRRSIVAYRLVVAAIIVTALMSFSLWVYRIQIFAWIATIWSSPKIVWSTPLLFMIGFIILFVIGGLTSPMIAVAPCDWRSIYTGSGN